MYVPPRLGTTSHTKDADDGTPAGQSLPADVISGWSEWLKLQGLNEVERYLTVESQNARHVEVARWGYAGGLALNPTFRQQRDLLREAWNEEIASRCCFPRYPTSILRKPAHDDSPDPSSCEGQFKVWYGRWSLEQLATWEIPLPIFVIPTLPTKYQDLSLGESGLVLHIPWYMLRDKKLKLRDLADHALRVHVNEDPRHYMDGKPARWGHRRLTDALRLYVIWELTLGDRYSDRIDGATQQLEMALGAFWRKAYGREGNDESNAESLRKIRQFVRMQLRASVDS